MKKLVLASNDPSLRSFIDVPANHDFPIQNLPFGVFKTSNTSARVGVAIGDYVLDLAVLENAGFFQGKLPVEHVFDQNNLNVFMALGQPVWRAVREHVSQLLRADNPILRDNQRLREQAFHLQKNVTMLLPVKVGGYTDFYSSKEHATNLGLLFRGKENPLLPNWLHIPVGYDGRASTIVVSGTDFHRPCGQIKPNENEPPIFSASRALDVEIEVGFIVGVGNQMGEPITVDTAPLHVFGMVLLADWSARDIQKWEYVPLGPFLGKNFCTSISPWIVMLDALEPFRVEGGPQDPQPLEYLRSSREWNYAVQLDLSIQSKEMQEPKCIARTNYAGIYWDFCQQLAHHTVNGCQMMTGDIFASGTISGATPDSFGSLVEITWGGSKPIQLTTTETRKFIQDGDKVAIQGYCQNDKLRIGFGEVSGTILPARQ